MTKKKLPNVCEEPEPVARAWAILREELGFLLLHDQRQRVYDVIAHECAEMIRTTDLPDDYIDMFDNGTDWAANLIDPEEQR